MVFLVVIFSSGCLWYFGVCVDCSRVLCSVEVRTV